MDTAGADVARSRKPDIIEFLFNERWGEQTSTLSRPVVTLEDIVQAIRQYNARNRVDPQMSDRNPANFFKDYIRKRSSANVNWPPALLARGYTARQRTGNN